MEWRRSLRPRAPLPVLAPACQPRHSRCPREGTQAFGSLPARPPRRQLAMARRSSLSIRIVEGKNLPAKDM